MPKWEAQPHTLAKIDILRGYLNAWFPILSMSNSGRSIYYIDGFAGPGRYEHGQPGSPLVALECAGGALVTGFQRGNWRAGPVYCLFVETDRNSVASLKAELAASPIHKWIHQQTYFGEFDLIVQQLRQDHPAAFADSPLFVFLDPFGPTGLTFDTVAALLRSPRSEVLLHFDADGATRMIQALEDGYNTSSQVQLDRVFGGSGWTHGIVRSDDDRVDFDKTTKRLAEYYLAQLRKVAEYSFPFQMITPQKREVSEVGYYLIFASNHPLGLIKMKEAMRRVGQDGGYRFSNFRANRPLLFTSNKDISVDALLLHSRFAGEVRVPWKKVLQWVLNETSEISPKPLLSHLERNGLIQVHSPEARKRRFTYPERIEERLLFDFIGESHDG